MNLDLQIGLWGPTQCGKTTYLAALGLAAMQAREQHGRWTIAGSDQDSDDFLVRSIDALLDKRFPDATQTVDNYHWQVSGDVRGTRLQRLFGSGSRVNFGLRVLDGPGGTFDAVNPALEEQREKVLAHFFQCDGLIYLHDRFRADSRKYVVGIAQRLWSEMTRRKRTTKDDWLPHHLAVCVTKFDDQRVFNDALERGFVIVPGDPDDQYDFPEPADPKEYFETIAHERIVEAINQKFEPARTNHFATSAIGFRTGGDGRVSYDSTSNAAVFDGETRIIDEPRPLNVLEPLIWLERQIRKSSGATR